MGKELAKYVKEAIVGKTFRSEEYDLSYKVEGLSPGIGPMIKLEAKIVEIGDKTPSHLKVGESFNGDIVYNMGDSEI